MNDKKIQVGFVKNKPSADAEIEQFYADCATYDDETLHALRKKLVDAGDMSTFVEVIDDTLAVREHFRSKENRKHS